jgi:hypothetical protein
MKLKLTQLALLMFLTSTVLGYDINKALATTSKPSYFAQAVAGWFGGLVSHELGHIATIEYSGGDFLEFADPTDSLGIPTLWMSGSGSQVGAASMMGNNTTIMLSNKVLNDKYEESAFLDGFLFFGILNPISYSLDPEGVDFYTASAANLMDRNTLRAVNLVQSLALLDKAINNRNDYYGRTVLNIALDSKYIKFSNTGKIQSTQQYWIDETTGAVNISVDYDFGDYKLGIGRQRDSISNLTANQMDYLQITKDLDIRAGIIGVSIRLGESVSNTFSTNEKHFRTSVSLDYASEYVFANYDSYNDRSTIGLKLDF